MFALIWDDDRAASGFVARTGTAVGELIDGRVALWLALANAA